MDIAAVLAVLRPGQDWGPGGTTHSTYAQLAAGWRGADPVPAESEMLAEWDRVHLAARRAAKMAEADLYVARTLAAGLAWGGKVFSLSAAAQVNWTNLFLARDLHPYPREVSLLADGTAHAFTGAAEVADFYAAGLAHVAAALDVARDVKARALAAQTAEELDAITLPE